MSPHVYCINIHRNCFTTMKFSYFWLFGKLLVGHLQKPRVLNDNSETRDNIL